MILTIQIFVIHWGIRFYVQFLPSGIFIQGIKIISCLITVNHIHMWKEKVSSHVKSPKTALKLFKPWFLHDPSVSTVLIWLTSLDCLYEIALALTSCSYYQSNKPDYANAKCVGTQNNKNSLLICVVAFVRMQFFPWWARTKHWLCFRSPGRAKKYHQSRKREIKQRHPQTSLQCSATRHNHQLLK